MKKDRVIINQSRCESGGVFAVRLVALCVVLSCLFYGPDALADDPNSRAAGSNIAAIASNEVVKRQQRVQQAQTLFTSGSKAYSDRSYGEAMDYFKAAFETTPGVPATAEMRLAFFKRYQRAALSFTEILIEEAKWAEAEQTLDDVYNTAERGGIAKNTLDLGVRKTLERLKSKDYYNMANSPRHIENIAEVQRRLTLAKGYAELGAYDRALRAYNQALAIDPYNKAARRGAEIVERHIMDYADAARNHTRSAMLAEIGQGWEMPVPDLKTPGFIMSPDTDLPQAGRVILEAKLKRIIIPSLEFNEAELGDVLEYLAQKAQELDVNESDPLRRGLNIVVDAKGSGEDPAHKTLSVRISNVPLGTALKYVTQLVGMKYIVGDYAVSVVPLSAASDEGLMVRSFSVPPGFIQGGGAGADSGGGDTDPFAPTPDGGSGTLVVRIKAQEFLEQRGITFGPGAVANYSEGTLIVKNTPDQIAIIESMVQVARDAGSKNVQVDVKMVSIGENELKVAGIDWLLGGGSLGGGGSTFIAGGTNGNSVLPAVQADYPFPIAGMNPVTSGLRTGNFSSDLSIDDILVGAANPNGVAPGVFAVSKLSSPQVGMVIRALDQMKGSDLLCDAHVTVNPGQKARIEQVREFIYPTEYDPPEIPNQVGGGGGTIIFPPIGPPIILPGSTPFIPVTPATPTAFEMRKVGKILEVEPIVSEDNKTISVNILADFVDFVGFVNYGTPIAGPVNPFTGAPTILTANRILMPVFDVIRETTGVQVWDGNTIVIGGFHGELISETADKIPGIGDLPLVGRAFRSTTSARRKKALLIFVTIRLVDPGGNPLNAAIDELAAK